MLSDTILYSIVAALWLLTMLQGAMLLRGALRFLGYVRRSVDDEGWMRAADGSLKFAPRVVVFLPCRGVDERLHQTVAGLAAQDYPDYEVVFTFESSDDPAYSVVGEWIAGWQRPKATRVVAGLAERRGQKIHNLLAAIASSRPDREVFVFLDSDALPDSRWLSHLVAPLQEAGVGAATGFRWYSAAGGLANGIRSCWNAGSLTLITDENMSFVWGGSTAIRRETFERLNIAGRWDRALSDDYQVTRSLHEAGLGIRFVPQALVPSHDLTTLREFITFARRQLVITRVCGPALWRGAMLLCVNFIVGGTAVAVSFFSALFGWHGDATIMWLSLAGWGSIMSIACLNAALRQAAIRYVLRPPDVTWKDVVWDVGGANLSGMLHLSLLLASLTSRRFTWRNVVYELVSPDETSIIERRAV